MLQFNQITEEELRVFIPQAVSNYAAEMLSDGEFTRFVTAHRAASQEVYGYLEKSVETVTNHIYSVKQGKTIVGYLWFLIDRPIVACTTPPHAFLNYIFVDEKYRGQHIADQIMDFYQAMVQDEQDITTFILYVSKQNKTAIKLYQRYGYHIVAETAANQHNQPTRYKMIKELKHLQND